VVRRFGFSHSLWIDGAGVERAYRKTPKHWPWIIHAAEGTDAAAAAEFAELERLHCVDHNTLLVHCVGLGKKEQARLIDAGGAAIWCPSSNDFLLGATLDFAGLSHARRLALGTDSRLSGSSDLLTEIRQAAAHHAANAENLLRMVTADAAALLNLPDAGVLRPGAPADLVILPRHSREPVESLLETDRAAIRLVMLGGKAQVGDPDLKAAFEAGRVSWTEGRVDGRAKLMNREWSDRLQGCAVHEPGVEL
jgi:cytosine/adenosine deaminase-related metal-dependent hydrolase